MAPTQAGIGFGIVAGSLAWLLPLAGGEFGIPGEFGLLASLGLPIGFGVLAGMEIPGWSGWRGYSTGLVLMAIVGEVINAILQSHNVYAQGLFMILVIIALSTAWTVLGSAGYAIAAVVRRRRHPRRRP